MPESGAAEIERGDKPKKDLLIIDIVVDSRTDGTKDEHLSLACDEVIKLGGHVGPPILPTIVEK